MNLPDYSIESEWHISITFSFFANIENCFNKMMSNLQFEIQTGINFFFEIVRILNISK